MSMEIEEVDTGHLMKPDSEYPLRGGGGGAAVTHRRRFQPIPAPFMSPPLNPSGSNPSAVDGVASRPHHRFTAISAAASSSAVGVYASCRRIRNPKSTPMTMFYNGAVHVFDVPVDKAREIVVLANRASVSNPQSAVHKSDYPVPANTARFPVTRSRKIIIQKPGETIGPHVSVISSPISIVSQAPTISKGKPGYPNYTPAPTTSSVIPSSVVPPPSQASSAQRMQQASAAIKPVDVHQSRKASLARFLERRKERVSSVTPYPLSKSRLVSSGTLGSASTPSKLCPAHESMNMVMYNDAILTMSRRMVIELE